jgi:hypothetical protein
LFYFIVLIYVQFLFVWLSSDYANDFFLLYVAQERLMISKNMCFKSSLFYYLKMCFYEVYD